jgi:hypothetical protein
MCSAWWTAAAARQVSCRCVDCQHGAWHRQVAEALRERAERIYDKYGNVMLDTEGMTKAGIERKATCRALFSKLLYLVESEALLPQVHRF